MNFIDFIIGLTLVNTIPHFVIGIWKGRMLSGLGFSSQANIWYGLLNFTVSISLFLYTYGFEGLQNNGMYTGAFFVVFMYFIVGKLCYNYFHKRYFQKNQVGS
ncbi:hypothetical protein BKI52_11620 [marine bacterium AO1-C]|nr:hypothetical protein BKI52_11620 [marine bacterium AO1-C]